MLLSSSCSLFLSTLPVRGATYYFFCPNRLLWISIHAPREGSDGVRNTYEERQSIFLSTLPVRGATSTTSSVLTG